LSGNSEAGVLVLTLDHVYTGATPSGTGPWLTATFTDLTGVDAGKVELKLAANLQSSTEFFDTLGFNYGGVGSIVASALPNVTFVSGSPSNLSGGGAGDFSFGFNFANPPSKRFNGSDVLTMTLSSAGSINAQMFNVASNGFYSGAHVNGIGNGSGKISDSVPQPPSFAGTPLPEPASLALLLVGSIGIGTFRLRRKKAAIK
jgi:hypothetical protein